MEELEKCFDTRCEQVKIAEYHRFTEVELFRILILRDSILGF